MKASDGIFSLILIGAVLVFFGWACYDVTNHELVHQFRSESFPRTDGTVESSVVHNDRTSKGGIRYHPEIAYAYEVNGHHYWSRQYLYGDLPFDSASANRIVNEHPAGSVVEVYYNPANPADSVLSTSVVAGDIAPVFLLMPMAVFFARLWLRIARKIDWPGRPNPVAGGVTIITEPMTTRIRLSSGQASALGFALAGVLSFISGIIFLHSRLTVSASAAGLYLVLIVVVGVIAYWWQHRKIAAGFQDLVIHENQRTFELPLSRKHHERQPLPISEINAVFVEKEAIEVRGGTIYRYIPTLEMKDGTSERLTDLNKRQAEAFAKWLSEKIRHPGRPG